MPAPATQLSEINEQPELTCIRDGGCFFIDFYVAAYFAPAVHQSPIPATTFEPFNGTLDVLDAKFAVLTRKADHAVRKWPFSFGQAAKECQDAGDHRGLRLFNGGNASSKFGVGIYGSDKIRLLLSRRRSASCFSRAMRSAST